jgi:hypothetical protein
MLIFFPFLSIPAFFPLHSPPVSPFFMLVLLLFFGFIHERKRHGIMLFHCHSVCSVLLPLWLSQCIIYEARGAGKLVVTSQGWE